MASSTAIAPPTHHQYRFTMQRFAEAKAFLEDKGYVVIDNVIPADQCGELIDEFKTWWSRFGEEYPSHIRSIMHRYNVGHLAPTWKTRLLVKPVFEALWGTKKLLCSFDGVAISEPPEKSNVSHANKHSLHLDQGKKRRGLHAYQGAVYLEGQEAEDWCFQILSESHKHFESYWKDKPGTDSRFGEYRNLTLPEIRRYLDEGCEHLRIPVGQGSVLLWDSRLVHDGAAPLHGRKNSEKWRYTTFVSMTPAHWATLEDLMKKRQHFNQLLTTTHWSSSGVSAFRHVPTPYDMEEMSDIARTDAVQLLAGMQEYDLYDEESNGPEWSPNWYTED